MFSCWAVRRADAIDQRPQQRQARQVSECRDLNSHGRPLAKKSTVASEEHLKTLSPSNDGTLFRQQLMSKCGARRSTTCEGDSSSLSNKHKACMSSLRCTGLKT